MAESLIVRTLQDVVIVITDGSASYTVAFEPGDLSIDFPLFNVENFLDRGQMPATPSLRRGDDAPVTFSFTANERDWGSASDHATLLDLAVVFAATHHVRTTWTSTMGTNTDAELYTWTVNVTQEGSNFGESDLTLALTFSTLRASRSDGYPNTTSITGVSYVVRPVLS
jgi:hypothetical protein